MGTQKNHLDETVLLGTQLVHFVHDIISNLDGAVNRGHKQTDLIIMDFAKAFDKVPHRDITQIGLLWDKRIHRGSTHGSLRELNK